MTDTIEAVAAEPAKKAPALWKQLLGACSGALVALGMYGAYQYGGETIAGYITPPGWMDGGVPVPLSPREINLKKAAEDQLYEMERIASQAAMLAQQMSSASSVTSGASAMAASSTDSASSMMESSGASSSGRSQWRTGSRWSAPTEEMARAAALPDSGFPLIGVIGAALGGAIVRRRGRKA